MKQAVCQERGSEQVKCCRQSCGIASTRFEKIRAIRVKPWATGKVSWRQAPHSKGDPKYAQLKNFPLKRKFWHKKASGIFCLSRVSYNMSLVRFWRYTHRGMCNYRGSSRIGIAHVVRLLWTFRIVAIWVHRTLYKVSVIHSGQSTWSRWIFLAWSSQEGCAQNYEGES